MTSDSEGPSLLSQIAEDAFGMPASSGGRHMTGRGKADIAGRVRVSTILKKAGINATAPERIAGSTNEVWKAGDYVIRVGRSPEIERLRREARLGDLLPWDVRYPPVVSSGVEPFGEWIVARHRPGLPMSEVWPTLDRRQRRTLVHELARAIKSVHETELDDAQMQRFTMDATSLAELPQQLPARRVLDQLRKALGVPGMDGGLVRAAAERVTAVAGAFGDRPNTGLVHGDLHFENVLVRNGALVSVLDFEWCRPGPRELDLDVLARFCAHPDLTVGGDYQVSRDAYRPVLGWVNEVYPELFSAPNLNDRLMLCALSFEVPWLLKSKPPAPGVVASRYHPVNRLRALLDQGTEAERLGWSATGI